MQIKRILTRRWGVKRNTFQLVYEWEDIIKEVLSVKLGVNPEIPIKNKWFEMLSSCFISSDYSLVFEMNPDYRFRFSEVLNRNSIVPWIIDFYLRDDIELEKFYQTFALNPVVLVSSKEVYDYLVLKSCPLNIRHCALSISDKWRITGNSAFKKDFDVLLMGRQNPLLLEWLFKYKENHKIGIVSCRVEKGHWNYYTQDGTYVGNADNRESYMNLLKRSRISLYSTQGLDGDKRSVRTGGFSQVTPRFLECIATGNHVLARYAQNSDVDYYSLHDICKNIHSYDEFEKEMDRCLVSEVNMQLYSDYLDNHYTSVRAEQLKQLLSSI